MRAVKNKRLDAFCQGFFQLKIVLVIIFISSFNVFPPRLSRDAIEGEIAFHIFLIADQISLHHKLFFIHVESIDGSNGISMWKQMQKKFTESAMV